MKTIVITKFVVKTIVITKFVVKTIVITKFVVKTTVITKFVVKTIVIYKVCGWNNCNHKDYIEYNCNYNNLVIRTIVITKIIIKKQLFVCVRTRVCTHVIDLLDIKSPKNCLALPRWCFEENDHWFWPCAPMTSYTAGKFQFVFERA